jgi:hypothetical protein
MKKLRGTLLKSIGEKAVFGERIVNSEWSISE